MHGGIAAIETIPGIRRKNNSVSVGSGGWAVVVSRAAVPVAVCPRTFATIEQTLRLDEEQCGVGRRP